MSPLQTLPHRQPRFDPLPGPLPDSTRLVAWLPAQNIFVNSVTGEIKIGDLGLATVQQQGMSVVG